MIRIPSVTPLAAAAALASAALGACAPDPAESVPSAAVADSALAGAAVVVPGPAIAETQPDAPVDAAPGGPATPIALQGTVEFIGSKVTRSHVCAFPSWAGTLDPGQGTPETATLAFAVDTTSVTCDPDESGPMKDRFLEAIRGEDFLNVDAFPEATFRSTSIVAGADGGSYDVTGDLTIRGITRQIAFPAQVTVEPGAVSATAEFSLDRRDWELVYPGKPDDLVRDAFVLRVALSGAR